MKILHASQIRSADEFTITHEPVRSIDLMERAARACFAWIKQACADQATFLVFCGPGNNGGDGLAIARMLQDAGYDTQVWTIKNTGKPSSDFLVNEQRFRKKYSRRLHDAAAKNDLPEIKQGTIVIDAIFGTGLKRPVTGLPADCITMINASGARIISIDLPSGLSADEFTDTSSMAVHATDTLTFQLPKFSFFFSSNEIFTGSWYVLDIGLDTSFISSQDSNKNYLTREETRSFMKPRKVFSHKGMYGHALLISGSRGKMGAAVMAAKACIRSGAGLLTVRVPECGLDILQTTVPEAMVSIDPNPDHFTASTETNLYDSVGIGPGIGTDPATGEMLSHLLEHFRKPMVIDADALNLLSMNKSWLGKIPRGSILTPHPKEFERLAGKALNDFDRHELQIQFARKFGVYVVLKGAYTCTADPDGQVWFNTTGNPGMARGGSGDVLTGLLLGLLTQGYSPLQATLLGVYLHGLAGDIAAQQQTQFAMTPTDLIRCIPAAYRRLL